MITDVSGFEAFNASTHLNKIYNKGLYFFFDIFNAEPLHIVLHIM